MDTITTPRAPAPKGPYSQGRLAGGLVYVAGQGPFDPVTGELVGASFEEQARRTLENVKSVLEAAGASVADVVKVNVYLSDLGHFQTLNEVYREYFPAPYPARTTVQAGLPGFLIEVDAVARLAG